MGWQPLMNLVQHTLDDITNGVTYGRIELADLTNGRLDIDKIQDGVDAHLMLTTEKNKLVGIESGAQVNEVTGSNILAKINASTEATKIAPSSLQDLSISKITNLQTTLDGKVPNTRKVNTHPLSEDVTISKGDVGLGLVENKSSATIRSEIVASDIPALDASKIATGIFDVLRVPDLDASKITTGAFTVARIPNLAASKITSGEFDAARIPDLNASKITTGVFSGDRIDDDAINSRHLEIDAAVNWHQHSILNLVEESGTEFPTNPVDGQKFRKDGISYIYKAE